MKYEDFWQAVHIQEAELQQIYWKKDRELLMEYAAKEKVSKKMELGKVPFVGAGCGDVYCGDVQF